MIIDYVRDLETDYENVANKFDFVKLICNISLQKFDMVTVEYLAAVALDMFVYCYFGNQITLQVFV